MNQHLYFFLFFIGMAIMNGFLNSRLEKNGVSVPLASDLIAKILPFGSQIFVIGEIADFLKDHHQLLV